MPDDSPQSIPQAGGLTPDERRSLDDGLLDLLNRLPHPQEGHDALQAHVSNMLESARGKLLRTHWRTHWESSEVLLASGGFGYIDRNDIAKRWYDAYVAMVRYTVTSITTVEKADNAQRLHKAPASYLELRGYAVTHSANGGLTLIAGGFSYCGKTYDLTGKPLAMLRTLIVHRSTAALLNPLALLSEWMTKS